MRTSKALALAFAGLLLTGIAAVAGVKTDYDHNLNFENYHTSTVVVASPNPPKRRPPNPS